MFRPRARSRLLALGLAALSGVLFWAAYPPVDLWPLTFVSWIPLLIAARSVAPREALLLGAIQGFVANAIGSRFLPAVVQWFGTLSLIPCLAISSLLWGYAAGVPSFAMFFSTRAREKGWPDQLTFPLAIVASETFYPLIVPTCTAAHVHSVPLLMQLADIGGTALVSVPLLLVNVAFAEILAARLDRRAMDRGKVLIAAMCLLATVLYGAVRVSQLTARMQEAPAASIGLVQGNTPHRGVTYRESIDVYRGASTALAAEQHVDLFVWPETALATTFSQPELAQHLRADVARVPPGGSALSSPILTGTVIHRATGFANSAVLFEASGAIDGTYDKVHPLVMGEYAPFGDVFPKIYEWFPSIGHVAAGSVEQAALILHGHILAPLICYEDVLPEYVNAVVARNAPELLVNMTNDSWFGDSGAAAMHFALAQFRSVEHRRFLVRAANSGVSGFVDAVGRASGQTAVLERATRVGEVRWMSGTTIYERVGDWPWGIAGIVVVTLGFVRPRRRGANVRVSPKE